MGGLSDLAHFWRQTCPQSVSKWTHTHTHLGRMYSDLVTAEEDRRAKNSFYTQHTLAVHMWTLETCILLWSSSEWALLWESVWVEMTQLITLSLLKKGVRHLAMGIFFNISNDNVCSVSISKLRRDIWKSNILIYHTYLFTHSGLVLTFYSNSYIMHNHTKTNDL